MKQWRKVAGSKSKGISDGSPIGLYREQVLYIAFFNILGSIGVSRENSLNRLMASSQSIGIIGRS